MKVQAHLTSMIQSMFRIPMMIGLLHSFQVVCEKMKYTRCTLQSHVRYAENETPMTQAHLVDKSFKNILYQSYEVTSFHNAMSVDEYLKEFLDAKHTKATKTKHS